MKKKEYIINEIKKSLESWCYTQARLQGEGPDGPYAIINFSEMEQPGVFMVSVEVP